MARILVTDGEQRSSLATVRSLGRAGHHVIVCAGEARPLAGASRYCRSEHRVPDPAVNATGFVAAVEELIEVQSIDVLLPMTDVSAPLLLPVERPGIIIPFPPASTYAAASDKRRLIAEASTIGIPVPRQTVIEHKADGLSLPHDFQLPVILKPSRSALVVGNRVTKVGVSTAASESELVRRLAGYPEEAFPILLQQRIVGPGLGAFMLSKSGETIAAFAHRRIREKPPSGGVSVYRESVPLRDDIRRYAQRLLAHLDWTGVAMVEFKEDAVTGTPYLMEVNGRLWGSLQLAIDAGVDFPRLLIQLATGEQVAPVRGYREGIRTRWEWGDVDHLLAMLRAPKGYRSLHPGLPSRLGAVARFLIPWRPGDRLEVLHLRDPRPFLRESSQWFSKLRR